MFEMKLGYNRHTESLMEIAMAFCTIFRRNQDVRNSGIHIAEWKHHFVDWANEFESVFRGQDWRNGDYVKTIEDYTFSKVNELIGMNTEPNN